MTLHALPTREPWLSKRELAQHLGASVRWVEQQMTAGMPYARWGRMVRFQRAACEAWLANNRGDPDGRQQAKLGIVGGSGVRPRDATDAQHRDLPEPA